MAGKTKEQILIQIAREKSKTKRILRLAHLLRMSNRYLKRDTASINFLLDVLESFDLKYHKMSDTVSAFAKSEDRRLSFSGALLHSYLPGDILAIIELLLLDLNHQANVLLRRIIEYSNTAIAFDLIVRWGTLFPETLWDKKSWKTLLDNKDTTLYENQYRKKIRQLASLNGYADVGKFESHLFETGTDAEIAGLLLSPICTWCMNRKKGRIGDAIIETISYDDTSPEEGDTELGIKVVTDRCDYCRRGSKRTIAIHSFVLRMPEDKVQMKIVEKTLGSRISNNLGRLRHMYTSLSEDFVHFSFDADPWTEVNYEIGGRQEKLWGWQAASLAFRNLSALWLSYFEFTEKFMSTRLS